MEPGLDFVVVGAGPAGLQAALGRPGPSAGALVCDSGEPRHAVTGVVHRILSRDRIDPAELRRIAAEELRRYPTIVCTGVLPRRWGRAGLPSGRLARRSLSRSIDSAAQARMASSAGV